VRHAVAAVQCVVDNVGYQPGIEACLLEGTFKALALGTVVVRAVAV
jgi:hypothetical protein